MERINGRAHGDLRHGRSRVPPQGIAAGVVMMTQRQFIGRTAIALALLALTAVGAWFFWAIADILVLMLISAILAAGFAPLLKLVEGRTLGPLRCSRGIAVLVVYLGLFGGIALVLSLILVPALGDAGRVAERLPQEMARLRAGLVDLHLQRPWLPDLARMLDRAASQASSATRIEREPVGVAFQLAGWLGSMSAVLVLTYYMLLEGALIRKGVLALVPVQNRVQVSLVLYQIATKFGAWLRGQVLLSFLVAATVAAGLLLLGMPYPFLLGLIAGAGELIPVIGPAMGAAVGILVALAEPTWRLIAVAAFYFIVLNLEPSILVPRIMARAIGLSPLLTLAALLIGLKLMGPLGGLLAVPMAAAIQVVVNELVHEIGRQPATPRDETELGPVEVAPWPGGESPKRTASRSVDPWFDGEPTSAAGPRPVGLLEETE